MVTWNEAHGQEIQEELNIVSLEGAAGSVIIVLHGGPAVRHNYLRPEWDRLTEFGRVYYYDQRGCGASTRWGPYSWRQHVEDLDNVLQHVADDVPIILAGSSWGSMLALLYAWTHPGRASALILSGLPPWDDLIGGMRQRLSNVEPETRMGWTTSGLPARPDFMGPDPDSAAVANDQNSLLPREILSRMGMTCSFGHRATMTSLFDAPNLEEFDAIRIPVFVAAGSEPSPIGDGGHELATAVPNSRYAVIGAASHDPWFEQPEVFFAEVEEFLRDTLRPQ